MTVEADDRTLTSEMDRSSGVGALLERLMGTDAITWTVLAFGFLIVKVLLVAQGDIMTALAVISSAGTVTVIVGAILSALPIIAAVVFVVLLYGAGRGAWDRGTDTTRPRPGRSRW
jgi:hypothetical protein